MTRRLLLTYLTITAFTLVIVVVPLGLTFATRERDRLLFDLERDAQAVASRSEGYHIALSVALALAPLAVEPAGEHAFVTAFLSRWGEAVSGAPSRRKRS